jgi:hypothetical protein
MHLLSLEIKNTIIPQQQKNSNHTKGEVGENGQL